MIKRIRPSALAWVTAAAALAAGPAGLAQDNPPDATPPPLAQPASPAPAPSVSPQTPPPPPAPPRHGGPDEGRPLRGPRHGQGPEDRGRDDMMPDDPHHGRGMEEFMRDHMHGGMMPPRREPVTFLGVAVAPVPPILVDQLNLRPGFGLLAEYVVPGSPADKAGIKTNDVLKSLNDQELVSPDQLATLVRSFPENQSVTLTLVHKGQETKLPVTLEKQAPPPMMMGGREGMEGRREGKTDFRFHGRRDRDKDDDADDDDDDGMDFSFHHGEKGDHGGKHEDAGNQPPPPPAPPVREILKELRPQLEEIKRAAREQAEQSLRREITILRERDGASRTTRLDLGHARIAVRDDAGELSLKVDDGKRTLVAKDPTGKVLYSGPVDTPEQRAALSADVRTRLEKLEREQMPEVPPTPPTPASPTTPPVPPAPPAAPVAPTPAK